MTVSQDSSSRKYVPASTAEWNELLTGLGINAPSSVWLCQESSGTLADSIGSLTLTASGGLSYQQTAAGWTRKGVKLSDNTVNYIRNTAAPDFTTTSGLLLQMFSLGTNPASGYRALNCFGFTRNEEAQLVTGTSGPKLRGDSNTTRSTGTANHAGVLVVVTKYDVTNSVLGVYTQHEQLKPTFTVQAAGSSTHLYMLGDTVASTDATMVYAAFWSGASAELTDSQIQDLLDAVDGNELTIEKMEAGSFNHKWVVSIEGCPYLLSDAPSAAVLNAYAGRDWTSVLGGLFVEVKNDQRIKPFTPFADGGTCSIRVVDTDNSDTFGKYVWRRAGGSETFITSTIDANDTTVNVKSTTGFASSGDIFIGNECIGYSGTTASSFTGCTRGKYSPFGSALSGSAGARLGSHHRVGTDSNHVQMNPVVSSIPRVWLGKRVAVRLHTWDAVNQTINARAEAQLVFAGRITDIADEPNTAATVIECDHVLNELQDAVIYKDQFKAEAAPGLALITGRIFYFTDVVHGSAGLAANSLTVVSGAPASTNQIQAGTYSIQEMCEALNRWLGAEKAAGRINGQYSWSLGANTDGIRVRCHWRIENATSNLTCGWNLSGPSDVMSFLGLSEAEPDLYGGTVNFFPEKSRTNVDNIVSGKAAPFTTLIFKPWAARVGQEYADSPFIDADNIRGSFVSQRDRMPASLKASCDAATGDWGLFLLDEKMLVVAAYDDATYRFNGMWVAPFQVPTAEDSSTVGYYGRRADDPDAGPVTIRQILLIEGSFLSLILEVLYSTGVSGLNHSTYDSLSHGLGIGIPGELLGGELERSLANLPGAAGPLVFLIDEPTTLKDLIGSDLMFRWAFLRWKDQHIEACTWKTPLNELSVADLSESNKMLPAGNDSESHRVATQESNEFQYAIAKIDFNRNFSLGRNGDYQKSVQFEDQTAVDDSGGGARTATLKLRNTFTQYTNTGSSVEAGLPEFMVHMPSISRSSRKIARTLSATLFESIAVGDIITIEDEFARDPLTGMRGVNSRAAFVTRVAYDIGGPDATPNGDARPMDGEIEVNFLDTQRGSKFAPSADIDDTAGSGGFSAGYNNATSTIRCYENHYSHELIIKYSRGTAYLVEGADASNFHAGDKILIVERDPANTASPTYWERTIQSVSGNDIVLTSALSAPAWDSTKRYRIVPQKYSQVVSDQRDYVYQADDADGWVEDDEVPWHYSATEEAYDYNEYDSTTEQAEFVPDMCYGDGRPYDVGHEKAIARTINAFIDRKSAHQTPYLHNSALALYDEITASWFTVACGPVFLGTEHLSATVTRSLTVAPFYRSQGGGTAKLRITILRSQPVAAGIGFLPGEQYRDSVYNDHFSQSSEYTTTSTTWQTGADATLSLDTKDIFFGFVWILVEGQGDLEFRGLAKCIEGPRET